MELSYKTILHKKMSGVFGDIFCKKIEFLRTYNEKN